MDPTSMGEFVESLMPIAGMLFALAVVWIIFRRPRRHGEGASFAPQEQAALEDLARIADRMDQRLTTLEKILDAEDPKWRDRAA